MTPHTRRTARHLRTWTSLLLLVPTLALAKGPTPAARRWWSHVEVLGADDMEGRETGSAGHHRAAEYVAAKLAEFGVQPGAGQSYFQEVSLVSRQVAKARSRMALVREGQEQPLTLDQELILSPLTGRSGHLDAGLVFVGYGLTIPETGHDDLAGLDVKGKVVVVLFGGAPPGVPENLAAHYSSMAELSKAYTRAGAVGVLALLNPRTAEVPWERIIESQQRPAMMLAEPSLQDISDTLMFAIINPTFMNPLLAGSSHTYEEILELDGKRKPLPHFALPVSLRGDVSLEQSRLTSENVVGRLPGSDAALAGESVVLSAHLDHIGMTEATEGDRICNGVMDNAAGVAALLEVARSFQEQKVKPRRGVLFVATTAEEKGLLGSRWFAARPPEGAGRMVANLNMDMFLPLMPLKGLVAYGAGESTLGTPLKASAAHLGIELMRDPQPEANSFIRSDQYSFILEGVPALSFAAGYRKGSKEERLEKDWLLERYHGPADDLSQPVDREAAVRFVNLLADLTQRVADAPQRPSWNADSFFRRYARTEGPVASPATP
ncbi:M28 family metallopeptidase [Vitiosangium sp. GDMCC 1.1324]|uniref:M28 family metallopeptidase n=1 Tax=Vitiosangium sp. (strain GDMCC 1.1324) TaxID=2138576 RepID=UPI000D3D2360|nr:M28 family metallopeptidase [Vitiosangium sp. GDMCC 1.1324]PTL80071.1 peptidase M28 [Vitiosangium sp. GDMCC 1.1324]